MYKKILIGGCFLYLLIIFFITCVFSSKNCKESKLNYLNYSFLENVIGYSFKGRWKADRVCIFKNRVEAENFVFEREDLVVKTKKLIIWKENGRKQLREEEIRIIKAWFSFSPFGPRIERGLYNFPIFLNLKLNKPINSLYYRIINPLGEIEFEKELEVPSVNEFWISLRIWSYSPFRKILEMLGFESSVGSPSGNYTFEIQIGEKVIKKVINIS